MQNMALNLTRHRATLLWQIIHIYVTYQVKEALRPVSSANPPLFAPPGFPLASFIINPNGFQPRIDQHTNGICFQDIPPYFLFYIPEVSPLYFILFFLSCIMAGGGSQSYTHLTDSSYHHFHESIRKRGQFSYAFFFPFFGYAEGQYMWAHTILSRPGLSNSNKTVHQTLGIQLLKAYK